LAVVRHACAEPLTAVFSAVSDYDYRGVSQTAERPAAQLDTTLEASHVRLDIFLSNVDFGAGGGHGFYGSKHTELAYTADVFWGGEEQTQYDAGVSYYSYPGWMRNIGYAEAFLTLSRNSCSIAAHYTPNYDNLEPRLSAYYLETQCNVPTEIWGLHLLGHLGESWGPYWSATNNGPYGDYFFGLSRKIGKTDVSARIVGTFGYEMKGRDIPFTGEARVVVSLSVAL
jgi:uncharacterized protein (TIGR02001 family)